MQGWEFLSMNEESITINDVSSSDGSLRHEIDFLYQHVLVSLETPIQNGWSYANAIGFECQECWNFMASEVERMNDGHAVYTIKVVEPGTGSLVVSEQLAGQYYSQSDLRLLF